MGLVDRLEKRVKELNARLKYGTYAVDENAYIDRELLEESITTIKGLIGPAVVQLVRMGKFKNV